MDETDRQILALLRQNARMPVSSIARRVGLSAAPVARRIQQLEQSGVIRGYTTVINDASAGWLEAFTEVRLAGTAETRELSQIVRDIPEVREFLTIAGDPDVLIRIRVDDVDHLQRVVNALRRTGRVTGTKTLIVMEGWNRDHDPFDHPGV